MGDGRTGDGRNGQGLRRCWLWCGIHACRTQDFVAPPGRLSGMPLIAPSAYNRSSLVQLCI